MFKQLVGTNAELIEVEFDGETVAVPIGVSVAAAMLLLDAAPTRHTALSDAPRAPFCMMGICFDCLMEINGIPNRRACQVVVAAGMRIRRQRGVRDSGRTS